MNLCQNLFLVSRIEALCFFSTPQSPVDPGAAQMMLVDVSYRHGVPGSAAWCPNHL